MTRGLETVAARGGDGSPTRAPFGPVDELSCYDDRPGEPNNVHLEAMLPGHLDHGVFRAAVAATLAEQPRARARRAPGGPWRRRFAWEYPSAPDSDPVMRATWADPDELARTRASFLDSAPSLDTSPPLRLLLATGPETDCVILNAHHAALDGISCLQLLYRVARTYSGAPGQAAHGIPASRPIAASSKAADSGTTAGSAHGDGVDHSAAAGRLLPRPAARITPQHENGVSGRGEPGYGFHLLRWPCIPAVPRDAGAPAATVNDALIAAMIIAISRWNGSRGGRDRPIRITMPLGGRAARPDDDVPLGNLSRLAVVTAHPPGPGGGNGMWAGELIAEVARQTRRAKDTAGPQVDPLSRALVTAWGPVTVKQYLLRAALRTLGPLVCDTSLISNLGNLADPPRFGSAAPEQMWFSTAAHMPRGLSLGVITTGGRLQLCFRYRRALFDTAAAAGFADIYASALSALTTAGPER